MATSGKEVKKQASEIKRALGLRGSLQPGDLTKKARSMDTQPSKPKAVNKKLPPLHTKRGVAFRGLI